MKKILPLQTKNSYGVYKAPDKVVVASKVNELISKVNTLEERIEKLESLIHGQANNKNS